ncbi:MAG: sulfotransferase [Gammaproteobacteria bacterium]|nr:sulfotransferase [Gammaproteobacteria bacterium]
MTVLTLSAEPKRWINVTAPVLALGSLRMGSSMRSPSRRPPQARAYAKNQLNRRYIYMVLLIAGHPRSGTTLLRRLCNAHPDIALTHEVGTFLYLGSSYKEYRRQLIRRSWDRSVLNNRTLLWS